MATTNNIENAPTPIEVTDFHFKQHCRLKIFESNLKNEETFKYWTSLLDSASRYGLIFVGTNHSQFQVIRIEDIESLEKAATTYSRRTITLPSKPFHISVNCDSTKLAVVVERDGSPVALIYDVLSFLKQEVKILHEIRLSATHGVTATAIGWNPALPEIFTAVKSDGSLVACEFKGNAFELNELPSTSATTCFCWSPKGKQIAVGSRDGKITQYRPDLKAVKAVNPPPLSGSPSIIALQWTSSFQFVGIYRANGPDAQSFLIVIDSPKTGNPTYINYEDICYSYGSKRPQQFYMLFQQHWNVLLVASSNSMELGIMYLDGTKWAQWILGDSSRAELPLSVDKLDTLPIGATFCTSTTLHKGEGTNLVSPLLMLLSNDGLLCTYHTVNARQGVPSLSSPPEPVADKSGLNQFIVNSTTTQINQPKMPSQPVAAPTPIATNIHTSKMPDLPLYDNTVSSPLSGLLKPVQPPTTPIIKPVAQTFIQPPVATPTPTPTPTPVPTSVPVPEVKQQPVKTTPSTPLLPKPTMPAQVPTTTTTASSETPAESAPSKLDRIPINEETDAMIAQVIREEYAVLELELKALGCRARSINIDVGHDNEATQLALKVNELAEFVNMLKETSSGQVSEVHMLKQCLIQTWAWYEDAKSRFSLCQDPLMINLLQRQPLDPASQKQQDEISRMIYYIESQLGQANKVLDEQWEMFQDSLSKDIKIRVPTMELVYQTMKKQLSTLQKQKYTLRHISSRLKNHKTTQTTPLISLSKVDDIESELSKLQLNSNANLMSYAQQQIIDRQAKLTKSKVDKLQSFLSNREVTHVSPNKPDLNNSTLKLTSLLAAPLSPIIPTKKLQPVKLDFVMSTPKPPEVTTKAEFKLDMGKTMTFTSQATNAFKLDAKTTAVAASLPTTTTMTFNVTATSSEQVGNTFIFKNANILESPLIKTTPNVVPQTNKTIFTLPSGSLQAPSPAVTGSNIFNTQSTSGFSFGGGNANLFNTTVKSPILATKPVEIVATKADSSKSIFFGGNASSPTTGSSTLFAQANPVVTTVAGSQSKPDITAAIKPTPTTVVTFSTPPTGLFSTPPKPVTPTTSATKFAFATSTTSATTSLFGGKQPSLFSLTATTPNITTTAATGSSIFTGFGGTTQNKVFVTASSPISTSTTVSSIFATPVTTPAQLTTSAVTKSEQVTSAAVITPKSQSVSVLSPNTVAAKTTTASIFGTAISSSLAPTSTVSTSATSLFGGQTTIFAVPAGSTPATTSAFTGFSGFIKTPAATTVATPVTATSAPIFTSSDTTTQSSIFAPSSTTQSSIFAGTTQTTTSPLVTAAPTSTAVTTTTSTTNIFESPTSQPLFAATTTQSSIFAQPAASKPASVFGGATSTTPIFSSVETTAATSQTSIFAGTAAPSTAASTTSIFGNAASTFGSASTPAITQAAFATTQQQFGASTTTTSPFRSAFTTQQSNSGGSLFGKPASFGSIFGGAATTSTPSIFGNPTTQTASVFAKTPATSASVFGGAVPSTSSSVFGNAPTSSNTSVFGSPATSSTNVFGGAAAAASPTNVFGLAATTSGSVFGSTTTPTNAFGGTTTSSSPFGATTTPSNIFLSNSAGTFGTTSNSVFGTPATTAAFGSPSAFGSSPASPFGAASTAPRPFGQPSSFGQSFTTTNANTFSFNSLSMGGTPTTNASGFGSSGGFGQAAAQNPFGRPPGATEQKSPFNSGSLFGTPATTSSSVFGGGSSPFNKQTPAFGSPAAFGSPPAFGQQQGTFGQQQQSGAFGGQSSFGSPSQGAFSAGGQSVQQAGFGAGGGFQKTASGFGSAPVFGSSPGFGSPPAFGSTSTFGTNPAFGSPQKVFGGSTAIETTPSFGGVAQNSTFGNMANQNTLGFGNLAQQATTPPQQPAFSGGSSFSSWR